MMNKIQRALCLSALFLPVRLLAQSGQSPSPVSPETNPFLDPAVQEYVESAYGYLNPAYAPGLVNDFRDSPSSISSGPGPQTRPADAYKRGSKDEPRSKGGLSLVAEHAAVSAGDIVRTSARPPAGQHYKVTFAGEGGPISSCVSPLDSGAISGFKIGDYVFISVLSKTEDSALVLPSLSAEGFRLSVQKTYFTAEGKKTFVLGWVPHSKLERIYKNPMVLRVAVEKKSSGTPFRSRIRFTLKAPNGEGSDAFVADFIRNLGSSSGFSAEKILRLPKAPGGAKFTAFEITGSLPVDMLSSVSLSPFVAAMEFQDKSL